MPVPDVLLALGRPLVTDGAMVTSLQAVGLPPGIPAELWSVSQPDRVEALHRAFLAAGADVILTNSFGANRRRLASHGAAGRVRDLNRASVEIARRAASSVSRPVLVVGSVGPTGAHSGDLSEADAEAIFAEQMAALGESGADAIWIETMASPQEACAAARAAASVGLPYALTASPHVGSGLDAMSLAALATALEPAPFAIGFNCGIGHQGLLENLAALAAVAPSVPLVAKPNAGLPTLWDGVWVYPAGAEEFGRFARAAVEDGARFVGGCCGTTPAHIAAIRTAVARESPTIPHHIAASP